VDVIPESIVAERGLEHGEKGPGKPGSLLFVEVSAVNDNQNQLKSA
jgi:hypothetical protein